MNFCIGKSSGRTYCKNKVRSPDKYCRYHESQKPNVITCKCILPTGSQCVMEAEKNGFCIYHTNITYCKGRKLMTDCNAPITAGQFCPTCAKNSANATIIIPTATATVINSNNGGVEDINNNIKHHRRNNTHKSCINSTNHIINSIGADDTPRHDDGTPSSMINVNVKNAAEVNDGRGNVYTFTKINPLNRGFTTPIVPDSMKVKDLCSGNSSAVDCVLCLEPVKIIRYDNGETRLGNDCRRLSCSHIFHTECISKIRKLECPMCRCEIIHDSGHIPVWAVQRIQESIEVDKREKYREMMEVDARVALASALDDINYRDVFDVEGSSEEESLIENISGGTVIGVVSRMNENGELVYGLIFAGGGDDTFAGSPI